MGRYLVMTQSGFGMRDAFFTDIDSADNAFDEVSLDLQSRGILFPDFLMMVPEKEGRMNPFLFPGDLASDEQLAMAFLRGRIRSVLLSDGRVWEMMGDYGTDIEADACGKMADEYKEAFSACLDSRRRCKRCSDGESPWSAERCKARQMVDDALRAAAAKGRNMTDEERLARDRELIAGRSERTLAAHMAALEKAVLSFMASLSPVQIALLRVRVYDD